MIICADRSRPDLIQNLCDNGADFILCLSGGAFGPKNDKAMQDRSEICGKHIVFVHPVQFLVTAPDRSICENHLLGDLEKRPYESMCISPNLICTPEDPSRVCYFDLPMTRGTHLL